MYLAVIVPVRDDPFMRVISLLSETIMSAFMSPYTLTSAVRSVGLAGSTAPALTRVEPIV